MSTERRQDVGRQQFVRLCDCGCGGPTLLSDRTDPKRGVVRGQPLRYISGHSWPVPPPLEERFWAKVDRSGGPPSCWPWLGSINAKSGYGSFNGSYAHRFAYELLVEPIPEGLEIDHVRDRGCSRKDCVNPAHLEAVTHRENLLRGTHPSAIKWRERRAAYIAAQEALLDVQRDAIAARDALIEA